MSPSQEPIPPERRHRAAYRGEIERAKVARILSELPAEHPARVAYATGAREAADGISLSHLVANRREIVRALVEANRAAWKRILARQGAYFRPKIEQVCVLTCWPQAAL